jgi:hypothetical protein
MFVFPSLNALFFYGVQTLRKSTISVMVVRDSGYECGFGQDCTSTSWQDLSLTAKSGTLRAAKRASRPSVQVVAM